MRATEAGGGAVGGHAVGGTESAALLFLGPYLVADVAEGAEGGS